MPLDTGRHVVEASAEGYETWRFDVAITGGRTLTLNATLGTAPGPVIIETTPPGAEVALLGATR